MNLHLCLFVAYVKGDAYSRFHVPFIFSLGETASAVQ
jgi:hypothetical protein